MTRFKANAKRMASNGGKMDNQLPAAAGMSSPAWAVVLSSKIQITLTIIFIIL